MYIFFSSRFLYPIIFKKNILQIFTFNMSKKIVILIIKKLFLL